VAMELDKVKVFLVHANKSGYGNESVKPIEKTDGSKTITFSDGEWDFHDSYFGGEPFGGREVIFYQKKPMWMMTYYGGVFDPSINFHDVYKILRQALLNFPEEMPVRGPEKIELEDWVYTNKIDGDFADFSGVEEISFKGKAVYRTRYQGGEVDKRYD
jgi:hypothetical protein